MESPVTYAFIMAKAGMCQSRTVEQITMVSIRKGTCERLPGGIKVN